jgi:hypothetical protein
MASYFLDVLQIVFCPFFFGKLFQDLFLFFEIDFSGFFVHLFLFSKEKKSGLV